MSWLFCGGDGYELLLLRAPVIALRVFGVIVEGGGLLVGALLFMIAKKAAVPGD